MLRRAFLAALFASLVVVTPAARAQPAQGLDRAKRATALVRISSGGQRVGYATAFCIDDAGYFVSNAHVADGGPDVELILDPGEKGQRVATAKVVRTDKQLDLALLQLTRGGPFTALPLGKTDAMQETAEIMALGYPFGAGMALDKEDFPAVSVNKGRITSLRKRAGELELIQVDAALNPGNSGGPVLNDAGQVVGIVKSGIAGSGVNFAIPVHQLAKLVKEPLVSVAATTLDYDKRAEPQHVTVHLLLLERPAPVYTVELTLNAGESAPRVLTGQTLNGVCAFNVPLAPTPPAPSGDSLVVSATFADGAVTGRTADRALQVGGQKVMLADVREVQFNADGVPSFSVGDRALTGAARDLDALSVTVGGAPLKPDWSKAHRIVVASAIQPVRSVAYTIKAKLGDKPLAPVNGAFALTGAIPESPAGPSAGMASLWPLIRTGLAEHRNTNSHSPGGAFSMKDAYTDVPENGGVLIGFNCAMGKFFNGPTIEGLQPIYLTEKGETPGVMIGKTSATITPIRAKRGYVVTSIRIRAGGNLDGIGLTFTRLDGAKLAPDDNYNGEWVGARQGGSEVAIDTQGGLPIGITGKKAEKIGSLAIVVLPPDAPGGPARADAPARTDAPAPKAIAAAPTAPPPAPEVGEPYKSFEQMFDTLPPDLQPANGKWFVGTRVSPELTHRLRNQPLLITGEFASTKPDDKSIELTLDSDAINYRGYHFSGQILAKFPADQADQFKKMRIHDKVTIEGKIQGVVVRGTTAQGQVLNKAFVWIENCTIK